MKGTIGRGSQLGRLGVRVIGGTAALLLLCAGSATASHIHGGAYYGDLPGGGTIEIFVSADGSEADAVTGRNVPSFPQPACGPFVEGTANDVPITNHAYAVSNNPGVTSSGSFTDYGEVSGSYLVQAGGCSSGIQAFTATIPVDLEIGRSNDPSLKGDGVYSRNGGNQTRKWSAKRGQTRHFLVSVGNDGPDQAAATVDGCSSSSGFKVSYDDPSDVTDEIVAGTYQRNLAAGASVSVDMQIKVRGNAKVGKTKSCKLGAEIDGTRDVVRAQLEVKPG
jgi:hypothetical protein